ncbi:MAG: penicillin-binding protein 2 [Actinomycetota bacterium]|nr:penicillin-binding protein 2 [Actinomycetota bacterium]
MTIRLVNKRIRLLIALFALAFALALVRAAWLQAVRAHALDRLGSSQQRETVVLPARRGTIYDRTGSELATGEPATTVWANPRQIANPRHVAAIVADTLDLERGRVLDALADRSRGFVYLARKADRRRAKALEQRRIIGIGFYPEERRTYPEGALASEVVGYAGTDNRGLAGIELELDHALAGHDGSETLVRDPFGRTVDVLGVDPVRNGRDVRLTIDATLQRHVEDIVRETQRAWSAKAATAVVLDPATGEILALAVEPGFDANEFPNVPQERQRNPAVTDTYEPGSTFKVVTLAAALETGMVEPWTEYTLPYSLKVSDRVIHDAEKRETETMTVAEILSRSSNVGVITLALGLGKNTLTNWIARFGFGRPTGVDFPGESRGIVLAPRRWSGSTIGNVPIGQGIAVTALQMASTYASIANGGVIVQPHLVQRVAGRAPTAPSRRRVISAETAKRLTAMLRGVVEGGSGTAAKVKGYTVAGKTGTAAKPDPVRGGYSESRYVASFVGFVPATQPRLVVLVTVDEPHGAIWGGTVAAPAFARIAEFALPYLEIPPDAGSRDK